MKTEGKGLSQDNPEIIYRKMRIIIVINCDGVDSCAWAYGSQPARCHSGDRNMD